MASVIVKGVRKQVVLNSEGGNKLTQHFWIQMFIPSDVTIQFQDIHPNKGTQ